MCICALVCLCLCVHIGCSYMLRGNENMQSHLVFHDDHLLSSIHMGIATGKIESLKGGKTCMQMRQMY